jgi:hypothetical protein
MNAEQRRLKDAAWKQWGPYVSHRQWGTVREDYSSNGDVWNYTTHDKARSKAYRWGEEGIGGISDDKQRLCFSVALWNKKDPIVKEILFGLSNNEGNHGEDVKEVYYHIDSTPTHSYMKMVYKYPQAAFPYLQLLDENKKRTRLDPEFELLDTGIFDNDEYFDVFIEYAKAAPNDILVKITVHNRSNADAALNVLPTIWFRNNRKGSGANKPLLYETSNGIIKVKHKHLDIQTIHFDEGKEILFCNNETNTQRLYGFDDNKGYYKDGVNDYLLHGASTVDPDKKGTKAVINYNVTVEAKSSKVFRLRLTGNEKASLDDFEKIFHARIQEADEFYADIQKNIKGEDEKMIQRQAFAGLLWNKQFYYYNVQQWLSGDEGLPLPPAERKKGRNHEWKHLCDSDIISMPDKWEYPWFAAWDLAFHCITFALIDIDFAKQQLLLLTKERYMHPNGTIPAYEWSFDDANPPVHAWAAWEIYWMEKKQKKGKGDRVFLESIFHKLLINFTWWVNRRDTQGNNIFEGGFLGLDNIGVFDRNAKLENGAFIEQADGTSWMAMFALNMLQLSLELADDNNTYIDMANKFFEHFLYIAGAIALMGEDGTGMWDEEDQFFYDQLNISESEVRSLKVRSMVSIIPFFAVEVLDKQHLDRHPEFAQRMQWFLENRPDLATLVSHWDKQGKDEKHLLSLLRGHRMKRLLSRMLDEDEFLSGHGIRALSKHYEKDPYVFSINGTTLSVKYVPGESDSDMFGGNSNWRGPVWMPPNYLIILSLRRFHHYYSDDFKVEFPTRSGQYLSLLEISNHLSERLIALFTKDKDGRRQVAGDNDKLQTDPHFKDYILFHEYFHGDSGKGLGAGHQAGWTALVANLIQSR